MKIAIMTQPLGHNYGGIMQAFALQQVLKDLGHEVITIDRQPDVKSKIRKTLSITKHTALKIIGRKKTAPIDESQQLIILQNTLRFTKQHIKKTAPITSTRDIKTHFSENSYDAVIVGSDQTWRPIYSPNILNFYLDFLQDHKIKRIAYATSFGVDHWEYSLQQTLKCKKLAQRFDAISVRESSGVELCRQNLNVPAEVTLDPTLLLSANEYLSKLNIPQHNKEGKLFAYILDNNQEKELAINNISKDLNLTLLTNHPKFQPTQDSRNKIDDHILPSLEDWIKSFNTAKFVITDSFHGCVFSIIFNKPFLAISNPGRGAARFKSLLEILNLQDRLITEANQITKEKITQEINWQKVNDTIEAQKNRSLAFINKNLI